MTRPRLQIPWFQLPNNVIDKYAKFLKPVELVVLVSVYRKTIGWGKMGDRISVSQIAECSGQARSTVIKCLSELCRYRLIVRICRGAGRQGDMYGVQLDERVTDMAGLEARQHAKSTKQKAKISNARAAVAVCHTDCKAQFVVCGTDTQKTIEERKQSGGEANGEAVPMNQQDSARQPTDSDIVMPKQGGATRPPGAFEQPTESPTPAAPQPAAGNAQPLGADRMNNDSPAAVMSSVPARTVLERIIEDAGKMLPEREEHMPTAQQIETADRALLGGGAVRRILNMKASQGAKTLMRRFWELSSIDPTTSWKSAAEELAGLNVTIADIEEAYREARGSKGWRVFDLHSIKKAALVHKAERVSAAQKASADDGFEYILVTAPDGYEEMKRVPKNAGGR